MTNMNAKNSRDVDFIEGEFVRYKNEHPEVLEYLVSSHAVNNVNLAAMRPLTENQLSEELADYARKLGPWGYSFDLSPELSTDGIDAGVFSNTVRRDARDEMRLRIALLRFIFDRYAPRGNWLDLATNCGIIPLLISRDFEIECVGVDIGEVNIKKAFFLKGLTAKDRCQSVVGDAYEHLRQAPINSFEFISALGIFYHLSNPLGLLELMFRASAKFVLIDTIIHNFTFSGWIQTVSRNTKFSNLAHANDPRKIVELHPTCRGMVNSLYQVGFSHVEEVFAGDELCEACPNTIYQSRNRRVFIAWK